jgi:hypothetical protein
MSNCRLTYNEVMCQIVEVQYSLKTQSIAQCKGAVNAQDGASQSDRVVKHQDAVVRAQRTDGKSRAVPAEPHHVRRPGLEARDDRRRRIHHLHRIVIAIGHVDRILKIHTSYIHLSSIM